LVRVQEEEPKIKPKPVRFGFFITVMYYIYILHSISFDKYYVGYTSDISRRIEEHNTSTRNTYTSKYRPWKLSALFAISENEGEAIIMERFIKKQKSKPLLKKLIDPNFIPTGTLAQLARVPYVRD
jgi:putative endonuclease